MTCSNSNPSSAAARVAARRRRIRAIRKWVVALAVTLFLSVSIVIAAQSHLATSFSTSGVSLSLSGSSPTGKPVTTASSGATSAGTTPGAGKSSPVVTASSGAASGMRTIDS